MTTVDQAGELARFLTPLLQGAASSSPSSADIELPFPELLADRTDPDIDLAAVGRRAVLCWWRPCTSSCRGTTD